VSENKKQNSIEPFLLNRSEAAKFLGIGLNTLGDLNIPKTRIRRRVLYRKDILEKWVKENTGKRMNKQNKEARQKEIIEMLFSNASKILFGLVSVELKIHEGRCVAVTYSTTENTRQKEIGEH
jgi:hypothetical protein